MKFILTLGFWIMASILTGQNKIRESGPVNGRWPVEKINKWYSGLPWLVGCNYCPATAINQIEMWQSITWDPKTIDKELGWAQSIGMNTLRVFLHDLVWADDETGLYHRMNEFLDICKNHKIRPWFVFFDDCHFPNPRLGRQPLPVKGYHNSGWLNCPARCVAERYSAGKATLKEVKQLKDYVQKTMQYFRNDKRILMWELYNEPGRGDTESGDLATTKVRTIIGNDSKQLVYDSWCWAREINPSQPVTSCTEGSLGETNIRINRINSDLYSVHVYGDAENIRKTVTEYKKDGRPVIVTEWLARELGSTVKECLPVMKELNSGAVNWGFVSGKTATVWNWNSRMDANGKARNLILERELGNVIKPGEPFPEPVIWFHDLFRMDGTPYSEEEIKIFRELTGMHKKKLE